MSGGQNDNKTMADPWWSTLVCFCGCHVKSVEVKKSAKGNEGKRFLVCPKQQQDQCTFFHWEDEPANDNCRFSSDSSILELSDRIRVLEGQVESLLAQIQPNYQANSFVPPPSTSRARSNQQQSNGNPRQQQRQSYYNKISKMT